MQHPYHLIIGAAALAAALVAFSFTSNRLVKRKLRLSIYLLLAYLAAHLLFLFRPDLSPESASELYSLERLALVAAIINFFIVTLINPLREDRVPDRYPAIVQDAVTIGLVLVVATFVLGDKFLTTSAVSA